MSVPFLWPPLDDLVVDGDGPQDGLETGQVHGYLRVPVALVDVLGVSRELHHRQRVPVPDDDGGEGVGGVDLVSVPCNQVDPELGVAVASVAAVRREGPGDGG